MEKLKNMTSVITGDIINSQKVTPSLWLDILKEELSTIGPSPLNWEVFRGDSFQVEVTDPYESLEKAIKIKASIKCIRGLDVRVAIGFGDKTFDAPKITESNGTAFVFSGEKYEQIVKAKINMAVASPSEDFDRDINLFLRFALIVMDKWSVNSAEMVKTAMENIDKPQRELGKLLGIKQNTVSSRLKRAYYDEITELLKIYQTKLKMVI